MDRFSRILITFLLLLPALVSGAADTLRIHLIYKHRLDNSGHSTGRVVVNQKLHSPDGILFREVSYDEITGQMTGYVFYFYRDGRLFTREFYNHSDSLLYILKYDYDQSGNETMITTLIPGSREWITTERTIRIFDNNHNMLRQKKYIGKKQSEFTIYEYDNAGLLIRENSKYKPAAGSNRREEIRSYSYSAENQLKQMLVSGIDAEDNPIRFTEEYVYNDKGRLAEVKQFDAAHLPAGSKVYQYRPEGSLAAYEKRDPTGLTIELLEYDYRIHALDTGIQVSRYEDIRNQ